MFNLQPKKEAHASYIEIALGSKLSGIFGAGSKRVTVMIWRVNYLLIFDDLPDRILMTMKETFIN